MADTVTTTDQSKPLDAGHTTSEYYFTKVTVFLSAAVALLSTIAAFVGQIAPVFGAIPALAKPVALISAVIGALVTLAYGLQRFLIKFRAIAYGASDVVPPAPVKNVDEAAANLGA